MIRFLIPTAKEMKASKEVSSQKLSEKSAAILTEMSKLSTDELSTAYKIKPEQAEKEKQRWAAILSGEAKSYPAVELFNGLMYRHIKRSDLSTCEKDFLGQQVFITSSFYGIIPAFYPIQEHRHDFHTKIKVNGQSLKNYWRAEYDQFLEESQAPVFLYFQVNLRMFLVQLFVSSYSRLVLWKTAMGFLRLTLRFPKRQEGLF